MTPSAQTPRSVYILAFVVCLIACPLNAVFAQPQTIQEGTVLILEMQTRLNSKETRTSDRFTARVIEKVTDKQGVALIPLESIVSGYVRSVTPAQYRRRSGVIEVVFDKLRLPSGREYSINGMLTSSDSRERVRIDEEGALTGGSNVKRQVVFIGAGTGTGAIIGVLTGGAALGAGVGAAVGVAAAFLYKGQEAVVEPGTRVGVEVTQSLDLLTGKSSGPRSIVRSNPSPQLSTPPPPADTPEPETPKPGKPVQTAPVPEPPPSDIPADRPSPDPATLVRLSTFQIQRGSDGSVGLILAAETSTAGWRLRTMRWTERDVLEVWLQGEKPQGKVAQVISYPATTLTVPDASRVLRRVIIHGANGDFTGEVPMR